MGLPGLWPASRGASTTSLSDPIDACSAVIAIPRRTAVDGSAPATVATAATTRPSSRDGNGWVRRTRPPARRRDGRRVRRRRSRRSSRAGTRSGAHAHRAPAPGSRGRAHTAWSSGPRAAPWRRARSTAGGPPPEANTRSNARSSSRVARRKSATTLTIPRRITTSRISSAVQASIWSSLWSARRARYSFGSADRPVAATVPPWVTRMGRSMPDRAFPRPLGRRLASPPASR